MYGTPHTRIWLEQARHVRVLHLFDGVCNLIDRECGVMSLVIPQIGRGPFSVVVPSFRFSDPITPNDRVICRTSGVSIGNLVVDLSTASIWNPCPAWDARIRDRLCHYQPLLIRALQELAPANSLAALIVDLPGSRSETDDAILEIARAASAELIAGLSIPGDSVQKGAAKLAGLGIGATPAGDDWLVGGMLALWSMRPPTETESIRALIAGTAGPRTTPLSAAWLCSAARGECHEHWHTLLGSIQADDETAVWMAAATLIQHGHTSGADALTGFVMILTSQRSCANWRCAR